MMIREGLSYDDVLLVPQEGVLEKRKDADISTSLMTIDHLEVPIISAPMSSVTGAKMALAMRDAGGYGIIHRFYSDNWTDNQHQRELDAAIIGNKGGVAIGIKDSMTTIGNFISQGILTFCLDIAHAHHKAVAGYMTELYDTFKFGQHGLRLIVGNVATAEGARYLIDHGAHGIKVGIGPGAACITREVTGFGVPQLTAVMDVYEEVNRVTEPYPRPTIIADGGIKNSGDIVKALAAGADAVMVGKLLAGADEAPHPGEYFGMASRRVNDHRAPEGVDGIVDRTGPVADTIKELVWGIRSGISYAGARDLLELRDNAEFMRVSPMAQAESSIRVTIAP